MSNKVLVISCIVSLIVQGCASSGFSFNIDSKSDVHSQPFEAKHRLLLATDHGGERRDLPVVCAEPSPDAMQALAFSGSFSYDNATAALKTQEAVAELGDRTALVQLLRDNLYRMCEAYMNGVTTPNKYTQIIDFWDVYTVTLMGMDSLTRTSRQGLHISAGSESGSDSKSSSSGDSKKGDGSSPSSGTNNTNITVNPALGASQAQPKSASGDPKDAGGKQTGNEQADKTAVASAVKAMQDRYFCMKAVMYDNMARNTCISDPRGNCLRDSDNSVLSLRGLDTKVLDSLCARPLEVTTQQPRVQPVSPKPLPRHIVKSAKKLKIRR